MYSGETHTNSSGLEVMYGVGQDSPFEQVADESALAIFNMKPAQARWSSDRVLVRHIGRMIVKVSREAADLKILEHRARGEDVQNGIVRGPRLMWQ